MKKIIFQIFKTCYRDTTSRNSISQNFKTGDYCKYSVKKYISAIILKLIWIELICHYAIFAW